MSLSLPTEIRLLILSYLRQDGCRLASLAASSREWQDVTEPLVFARVMINISRLAMFKLIAHRKRPLIRAIWFRIHLNHGNSVTSTANVTLGNAVFKSLLSTLSSWHPSDGDLTLDISILSPSDSKPCFAHIPLKPDLTPIECEEDQDSGQRVPVPALAPTASLLGRAFADIPLDNRYRPLFDEELLPLVPVVTSVVLRQQNRLRWIPFDLEEILSHMPRLQHIHYEPWRGWDRDEQMLLDTCKHSFFGIVKSWANSYQ